MKKQLGNFEIIEQIDPDGYTKVYRALEHMGQDITRPSALKMLQTWNLDDEQQLAILKREVEVLIELGACPNIVTIHGFGIDEDEGPWIAMELAGQSLRHFIRDEPADPEHVRVLLRDGLRALSTVHGAEPAILHRDLKPTNILSTNFGIWMVADFGLAKRRGADETLNLVTVQYAAPELLDATLGEESPGMDIYSLGMSAYQYALGTKLYRQQFPSVYDPYARESDAKGDERPKWMYWHTSMQMTVPPLSELIENYPQDLSDLIEGMTCKPLAERIPSANKALGMLGSVAGVALPHEVEEVEELEVQKRWLSPTIILASLVIAMMLAVGGVMYMQSETRPSIHLHGDGHYSGTTGSIQLTGTIEKFPSAGRAKVKLGSVERDVFVKADGSFICMVPVKKLIKQSGRLVVLEGSRELSRAELSVERKAPSFVGVVVKTRPVVAGVHVVVTDKNGETFDSTTNFEGTARIEKVAYGEFGIGWGHGLYKPRGWSKETFPSIYSLRGIETGINEEVEYELRLEPLTTKELFGRTQALMLRGHDLAKRKATCPPGPLSDEDEAELAASIRELRQQSADLPEISGFVTSLESVRECDPDSISQGMVVPALREPPGGLAGATLGGGATGRGAGLAGGDGQRGHAGAGGSDGRGGADGVGGGEGATGAAGRAGAGVDMEALLRQLGVDADPDVVAAMLKQMGGSAGLGAGSGARGAGAFTDGGTGSSAGEGGSGDSAPTTQDLIAQAMKNCNANPVWRARLMVMPLAEFRDFVEDNLPAGALTVDAVNEFDRVRIHGALFDAEELNSLVTRLCAAMPRIQPELRIDPWALCRRMDKRLRESGAQGVRVHPYLFPDDPTIYAMCEQSEAFDDLSLASIAEEFVVNEDILRVVVYRADSE